MGLSTKQVSSDGHGWNQALLQDSNLELPKLPMKRQSSPSSQQLEQQGHEQLKCPRCESTNTKFCYYNNYNKSQPRHFCKACKRHWTKGGTLRNVPIGGGRKNKRKTSNTTTKTASKTSYSATTTTTSKGVADNEKNFSEPFYQTVSATTFNKDGDFVVAQELLQYPYTDLGNFESISCSISSTMSSIQSPTTQIYSSLEETVMNNNMSSSSMCDHYNNNMPMSSWSVSVGPITNYSDMDINMSSNWGWDDFDKFVSVDAHLTTAISCDYPEIKP